MWSIELGKNTTDPSPDFPTIDPAPSSLPQSIPDLRTALLNTKLPLFERYRAMFALRDFGAASKEAVLALAEGFGDSSALFRYVPSLSLSLLSLISVHMHSYHAQLDRVIYLPTPAMAPPAVASSLGRRNADDQTRSSIHFRSTLFTPLCPITTTRPQGSERR